MLELEQRRQAFEQKMEESRKAFESELARRNRHHTIIMGLLLGGFAVIQLTTVILQIVFLVQWPIMP